MKIKEKNSHKNSILTCEESYLIFNKFKIMILILASISN